MDELFIELCQKLTTTLSKEDQARLKFDPKQAQEKFKEMPNETKLSAICTVNDLIRLNQPPDAISLYGRYRLLPADLQAIFKLESSRISSPIVTSSPLDVYNWLSLLTPEQLTKAAELLSKLEATIKHV